MRLASTTLSPSCVPSTSVPTSHRAFTPLPRRRHDLAALSGRSTRRTASRQHALKCYQVLDMSSSGDSVDIPLNLPPPAEAIAIPVPKPATRPNHIPPALLAVFQWYASCLEANPVLTKSLTALLGFCLGDTIAQYIEGTHAQLDLYRCLRLGSYGMVLDGPVQHFWYRFLDRAVWPEDSTSMKAIITKTAADQLLWSPLMTCVFFAWLKILEGHPDLILATIQAKLLPTLAANYLFWPLVHMFNFRYVPTEWRVLYNQVMCIAWIGFLSVLTHHGITVSNATF